MTPPKQKRPSLAKRILFSFVLFVTLLLVVDQCLVLIGWPAWARHESFGGEDSHLVCYSSDPENRFPYNLQESDEDRARARRFIKDPEALDEAVKSIPHCMILDASSRRKGLHPERGRKLALVGDSFTVGYGLQHRHSMGALLEKALPQFNVINHGIVGAGTERSKTAVEKLTGARGGPKGPVKGLERIVYFYNLNDMEGADGFWANGPDWNRILVWMDEKRTPLISALVQASGLYRAMRIFSARLAASDSTVTNLKRAYLAPENKNRLADTMIMIKEMRELAKAQSAEFLMVIFPMMHQDLRGRYPFGELHQLLTGKCKEVGVKCVDGLPAFEGHDMADLHVHRADSHPNELAVQLMVDYLIKGGHLPQ